MLEIIEWFGSKSAMAKALGVSRAAVSQWIAEGIPAARAIQIEALTEGKFKAVTICGEIDNG